jgi:hypothetical protein
MTVEAVVRVAFDLALERIHVGGLGEGSGDFDLHRGCEDMKNRNVKIDSADGNREADCGIIDVSTELSCEESGMLIFTILRISRLTAVLSDYVFTWYPRYPWYPTCKTLFTYARMRWCAGLSRKPTCIRIPILVGQLSILTWKGKLIMRYWVCEECGAGLSTEDDREVARCTGGPSALVVTNMGGSYDVRPTEVLSGGKGGGSGYVTVTQSTHWPLVMKEITSLVNNPDVAGVTLEEVMVVEEEMTSQEIAYAKVLGLVEPEPSGALVRLNEVADEVGDCEEAS